MDDSQRAAPAGPHGTAPARHRAQRGRGTVMVWLAFAVVMTAIVAAPAGPSPTDGPAAVGGERGATRDSGGFRLATGPHAFAFPRDHAAHPDYRTEWWYYTGHLAGEERRFGFELTFFRVGLIHTPAAGVSSWAPHTLYFAHAALTDETGGRFHFTEEASRPALGMAGADTAVGHVWVHGDSVRILADGTHVLAASAREFALALTLTPAKAPVVHGTGGVSWKSATHASHYYSITRLAARGAVTPAGREVPVQGTAWMDHEFFSGGDARIAGWDWFSIQLDDGRELMLYRLRRIDGTIEPASSGTLVERDGRTRTLSLAAWRATATRTWVSPATGARYPAGWRVRVPGAALDLALEPTLADQEVRAATIGVTYWEGSVHVRGTAGGRPVRGEGYVELTGYAGGTPMP
jgi:predicted secreted hydrolase